MNIATPGGTNDIRSFEGTELPMMVTTFPVGKYGIADNAYVNIDHLVTPFCGNDIDDNEKSTFNFYLSQLRIKIEQAFGFMTNKWRILRRPLAMRLFNSSRLLICITILHNYIIN